jgi:UTP-glucose-1-phosphate uridylyltransferase
MTNKNKTLKLYQVRNTAYDIGRKIGYIQTALKVVEQIGNRDVYGVASTLEKKVTRMYLGRISARGREYLVNRFFPYKK